MATKVLLLLALLLPGCTESYLSSASANCETFAGSLSGAGARCNHHPDPYIAIECDGAFDFGLDEDHVWDCRAWLDQQPCDVLDRPATDWPSFCSPHVNNL